MEEIWKPVKGFEGLYEVSNYGRVISHHKYAGVENRVMKFKEDKNGYLKVKLCDNGKHKQLFAHRIVAEAFIDNPNNYPMINHKDENKKNNFVENLEWCDSQYNNTYGHRLEIAMPKTHAKWSYTERARKQMSEVGKRHRKRCAAYKDNVLVKEFNSTVEAGRFFNTVATNISRCCASEKGTAKGYTWKYI